MTPQQLQEFNRLFEKYQGLNMSAEEASRKAIRDMTQKGLLKPQGGKKPVPRLTKGDWFEQLKATGTVMATGGATTEGIKWRPTKGYSIGGKKHGKEDDEERGC